MTYTPPAIIYRGKLETKAGSPPEQKRKSTDVIDSPYLPKYPK